MNAMKTIYDYPRQKGMALVVGNGKHSWPDYHIEKNFNHIPCTHAVYQDEHITHIMKKFEGPVFYWNNPTIDLKTQDKDNWYSFGIDMGWTGYMAVRVAAEIGFEVVAVAGMDGWTRTNSPKLQADLAHTNWQISKFAHDKDYPVFKFTELGPPGLPIVSVSEVLKWLQ
jgi:rhodanese-related sulfurtransferase